jgi:hypothetical protein
MKGRHISIQGSSGRMRGSDQVERIYVAFEVLRMSPRYLAKQMQGKGGSTVVIEGLIQTRLGEAGHSRRGRRHAGSSPKFMPHEKTGTIYSLWRSFKKRHPWPEQRPDPIVERHLHYHRLAKVRPPRRLLTVTGWGLSLLASRGEPGVGGEPAWVSRIRQWQALLMGIRGPNRNRRQGQDRHPPAGSVAAISP